MKNHFKHIAIYMIVLLLFLQSCNSPIESNLSNDNDLPNTNGSDNLSESNEDSSSVDNQNASEYLLIDHGEGKLKIFDASTYEMVDELFYECAYAISDDLSTLATAHFQDKYVMISTFPEKEELIRIPYFQDITSIVFCVRELALSSSGKYVAMAGPTGEVEIADTKSGEILSRFASGNADIIEMAFSPDEKYFAAVGFGANLIVWNMESNSEAFTHKDPAENLFHVLFSPDSEEMVILNNDNTMSFFSTRTWEKTGEYYQNGPAGFLQSRFNDTIITDEIYNVREVTWSTKQDTGRYANCVSPNHPDFVESNVLNASLSSDGERIAISCGYFNESQILVRNFNTDEIYFKTEAIEYNEASIPNEAPIPSVYFIP